MTNPSANAVGSVRIKSEELDDDYGDVPHIPHGRQSPTFMVYLDNAHALWSPRQKEREHIKEETEDREFNTAAPQNKMGGLHDVPEKNTVDNDGDNREDDREDDTDIPHSLRSSLGWKIVQTFNLGSSSMLDDSDDAGKGHGCTDHYCPGSSLGSRTVAADTNRKSLDKRTSAVKEEIHDREYDKVALPVNSNADSDSQNGACSADRETSIPVKEEEDDCERRDGDRLSTACVDDDGDISSTVNSEDGARGSALVPSSGVVDTSSHESADDFQKQFEDYVTGRYTATMNSAAPEDEVSNGSPFQLPEEDEPTVDQVPLTSYQPSQSPRTPGIANHVTVHPDTCQRGRKSSALGKKGRKTQTIELNPWKVYTCIVCSADFQCHKDLKDHSRVHKKKYRRYSKLLKMMKSESNIAVSDLFGCRYCSKTFTFAADLTKHLKNHEEQRWYEQQLLKYRTSGGQSKTSVHMTGTLNPTLGSKRHKGKRDNAGDTSHTCVVCGSVFPTHVALQIHMHHPERPLIAENSTLFATETSNSKPTSDGQKRPVHLFKPQFFSRRLVNTESGIPKLVLEIQKQSVPLINPQITIEREKSVQDTSTITQVSREADDGSGKTVHDGEQGNEDKAVLNSGSPKLSSLAAVDVDKSKPAHESFTQIKKKKDTAKKASRVSPLTVVWKDTENTVKEKSPVCKDRHKRIKKHTASVEPGCSRLKHRYSSNEKIEYPLTQDSHTTTTGNSIGKPLLDDKAVMVESHDRQIFFRGGSNSESQPTVVSSEQSSGEPCSTNKTPLYQPGKCKSVKICKENSADTSVSSRPFILEQSLPGDSYQSGAGRLRPHGCGHLATDEGSNDDHEGLPDACIAVSASWRCHRKTVSSTQHPEESGCDDQSLSNRTDSACPLKNTSPACDTSFQPIRDSGAREPNQQTNSVKVTEVNVPATALARTSHLNSGCTHSHTRRLFTCRYCRSVFDTPQGLSAHQRVHIKVMPYDCNQCTERFQTSQDLQTHNKVHLGSNPFLCVFCNALFPTIKGLRIHLTRNERENLAAHFCEGVDKYPVPLLARGQEGVPMLSFVNWSSHLGSALMTSPVTSSDNTSLTEPYPISHVHVEDGASVSEVTAGTSADGSSEAYHRSPVLLAPQRRSCPSTPSEQATGGSSAAGHSTRKEISRDEHSSFQQATPGECRSSEQDQNKCDRHSQPTGRHKRNSYALDEKGSCDHAETIKRGRACIRQQQATYHQDGDPTTSAGTGWKSDAVGSSCDFCEETSCRTMVLAKKKKRASFPEQATVTQTQVSDTAYLCVECHLSFLDKASLDRHLGIDPRVSYLTCSVCAQTFVCYSALQKHVEEHFSEQGSPASLVEGPLDLSMRSTRVSQQNTAESPANTYPSKQTTCHQCGKVFADGRGMWKHQKSHVLNKRRGKRTTTTKNTKNNQRGKLGK